MTAFRNFGLTALALFLFASAGFSQELPWRTLPVEQAAEGWISLFDGKTLFGWRPNKEANWRVEDGTITVDSGKVGLLCTTTQFDDYVLRLEFQSPKETNSGVFLRTPPAPKNPAADCYELNIAPPNNPFPTGSLVGRKKYAGAYREGWRTFEATLLGPKVQIKLDGELVLEYDDPQRLGRGFIGLQHNSGKVSFRKIELRPLGLDRLLGDDLRGWKEGPDQQTSIKLEDGELRIQGGPGQLEASGLFGNFILQLGYKTHAAGLNSGVFFRCIPGDKMMGYESQIHQIFQEGNRTKPEDCGAGGIFRRQDARAVVGSDLEWVHKTLIVDGPHIAVWVNGLQVTDWVDRRKPDENPRRGLRLEPGSIMLQAHDPTTDISFRQIHVREIAPRKLEPTSR